MDLLFLTIGIVILYISAESMVRGAAGCAKALGISPFVIGLTIVSLGTSLPECISTVIAHLQGHDDIAVGNIIGSNIGNIGLVMGLILLFLPITVSDTVRRIDIPFMISATIFFIILMMIRALSIVGGLWLVAALCGYVYYQWVGRRACQPIVRDAWRSWKVDALCMVGGAVAIGIGGKLLVEGATGVARAWGISERVVALTVVALGTSMPELVTSLIAAIRNQHEISIGTIVGSNIQNILLAGGAIAMISPVSFSTPLLMNDAPVMLLFSVLLWFFTRSTVDGARMRGALLLTGYAVYVISLFWR